MKIAIESTDVFTKVDGATARVWSGQTQGGVKVAVYVTAIQVPADQAAEFEKELIELEAWTAQIAARNA